MIFEILSRQNQENFRKFVNLKPNPISYSKFSQKAKICLVFNNLKTPINIQKLKNKSLKWTFWKPSRNKIKDIL